MLLRIIHFIARRCACREIKGPDGSVYLRRYRIFGWLPGDAPKRCSLYLHHFVRSDEDRELHNHPWAWAVSLILAGGYQEELIHSTNLLDSPLPRRRFRRLATYLVHRKPGRLNFLRGDTFHRVASIPSEEGGEAATRETWTLFLCGPKRSGWGFLTQAGFTPWRKFMEQKGMTPDYEEPTPTLES